MADRKSRTPLALTWLWFAALSAPVSASLVSVDAEKEPSFVAAGIERPPIDIQNDPGMVDLGGALYSPFSTALEPAMARTDAAVATPERRQDVKQPTLDLVTAAITAGAAAGVVFVLARLFIAT